MENKTREKERKQGSHYLSGEVQYHDQRTPGGPKIPNNTYSGSHSTSYYQPRGSSSEYHSRRHGYSETMERRGYGTSGFGNTGNNQQSTMRGGTMGTTTTTTGQQYGQQYGQQTGQTFQQQTGGGLPKVKGPEFNERDRINDLLSSEKNLTTGYNVSLNEMTNPRLHQTIKQILNETHDFQYQLFNTMQQRGWYKTPLAQQQEINQVKQQFTNYRTQFPY